MRAICPFRAPTDALATARADDAAAEEQRPGSEILRAQIEGTETNS